MNQYPTKYYKKMMGEGPFRPNSIVVAGGGSTLTHSVLIRSYLNFVFAYFAGSPHPLLWEDRSWTELKYRKMLKQYHGSYIKQYRPTKLMPKKEVFDDGIRKLYDEYRLRYSNRHSNTQKIIYYASYPPFGLKPTNVMIEELLKDGGRKGNIQFIVDAIPGTGSFDEGLLSKFDVRIATTPLSKVDSRALFGTDKYATKKDKNIILFGYKDTVEEIPLFDLNNNDEDFIYLIKNWSC